MENECAIEMLPVRSLSELINRFPQYDFPGQFVIADLSMGEWKARQIATDFFRQLAPANARQPDRSPVPIPSFSDERPMTGFVPFAELAGKGIDDEALNHRSLMDIQSSVDEIIGYADSLGRSQLFVIIQPLDDGEWLSESQAFLSAFGRRVRSTIHLLASVQFEAGSGALTDTLNGLLPFMPYEPSTPDGLIPLRSGCYLVPPQQRRPRQSVSRLHFDKLAQKYRQDAAIRAYAQFNGNAYFADPQTLRDYGWRQFNQGSKELGERFLQKAFRLSTQPIEKAIILCQLQGARIATWHFAAAAAEEAPSRALPAPLRQFLLIAKGWGAAMKGQLEMAASCLEEARSLYAGTDHGSREYLYLLNIIALLSYKKGDAKTALSIELQVKNRIDEDGIRDFQLIYVNSINIARIYKKMSRPDIALAYFEKAFGTTDGLIQEGELLYQHLILSDLKYNLSLQAESFWHLVRSAIHWLANPSPDSLSRRLHSIVGFSPVEQPDSLSAWFYEKIRAHPYYRSEFGELNASPVQTPRYASLRSWKGGYFAAMGCPPISILVAEEPAAPIRSSLGSIVYRVLTHTLPILNTIPVVGTILVPEEDHAAFNWGPEALLTLAIKLSISRIYWNNTRVTLGNNPLAHLRVRMNPGVSCVKIEDVSVEVKFKRYYPPVVLPPHFNQLLSPLTDGSICLEQWATRASIPTATALSGPAAELEFKKIIQLTCDAYEHV